MNAEEIIKAKRAAILSGQSPNLTEQNEVLRQEVVAAVTDEVTNQRGRLQSLAAKAVSDQISDQWEAINVAASNATDRLSNAVDVHLKEIEQFSYSVALAVDTAAEKAALATTESVNAWQADAVASVNEAVARASAAEASAVATQQYAEGRLENIDSLILKSVSDEFNQFKQLVEADPAKLEKVQSLISTPRVIEQKSALELFGVDLRDKDNDPIFVEIWNHPTAPAIDPNYVWNEEALRLALVIQTQSQRVAPANPPNLWLAGDPGTGKSQFAIQFAAKTGRDLVRINFDRHLERLDFIGAKGLVGGETVWQDGTFLKAFKIPGTVILLDEPGFANPANISNLQALLEPAASVTYDGFKHSRALGVLVFAADNSTGTGDSRFAGVQEQNPALLDRFLSTVIFDYLPARTEVDLICKKTGVDKKLADRIVLVIREARAKSVSGDIVEPPSLRQAFALASAIDAGITFQSAWLTCVVNKAASESKTALLAIGESFWREV